MPELPDVELFKRYLVATALHQSIEQVTVHRGEHVLDGISESELKRRLRGHALSDPRRHGKYLFAELESDGGTLVFHFGMTGFLSYYAKQGSAPRHARVVLAFENGYHLAFDCQRLLGDVAHASSAEEWIRDHDLGPDLLDSAREVFVERLTGRRGGLKPALMDQSLIAGCGNVYSDEILFQAKLHPKQPVSELDENALGELHGIAHDVLETAIECHADPKRVPSKWLLPHRSKGAECPRCGEALSRIEVGGRGSWICPGEQVEP